ncbi:MAG TPA: hypothetical protein VHC50_12280 [Puia sp.]|nr:hypothetical protein [Puia sp.]
MKKIFSIAGVAIAGALFTLLGCVKDRVTRTYTIQRPVYQSLTQARTAIKGGESVKIETPGKITLYKNYIFLNEVSKGIHVIDNTDPSSPRNISFINIPGNTDLSIRNNILYANDAYGDLVAFGIEDPEKPVVKKFLSSIFLSYYPYTANAPGNPDSILVITDWTSKDTTIRVDPDNPYQSPYYPGISCPNCSLYSFAAVPGSANVQAAPTTTGVNGSTSGFAISGQYLYALSSGSLLNVVDIAAADDPELANQLPLGQFTETIFPFEDKLFMGTTTGMLIYDLSDPSTPVQKGNFAHVSSCDPVITDGKYAYVTLRSGTNCNGSSINELDILSLSSFYYPSLVKTYSLTNPRGLSKDGNLLFICDGKDGLKIYDATDVSNLSLIKTIGGLEADEVIAQSGKAIVIAAEGLYQFDYTDRNNIHQLSKLNNYGGLF